MKIYFRIIVLLSIVALLGGCGKNFLESETVQKDPNRAIDVTADQLFNGVQVKTFFLQEGEISRVVSILMQSMAGTDRQHAAVGRYIIDEGTIGDELDMFYFEGGLVDIKTLRSMTESSGNRVYEGIVKFYEAFNIGTMASLVGDVSYSEAVTSSETPALDSQENVYQALQNLLDEAIADLSSGDRGVTLANSPVNDFNFDGDAQKWIAACYSLKARLYMHWAEVDASNYARALAAAQNGIAHYSDNFTSVHSGALYEEFGYYNFFNQRDSYIRGGSYLIDLLKTTSDPRVSLYFDPGDGGEFFGSAPGEENISASNLSVDEYLRPDKALDLLTWEETQLIIAEALYQQNDQALAAQTLDAVRRGIEQRWGFTEESLGSATGLADQDLLEAIMLEKYKSMFLNIEVYNDWKRTEYPVLVPFGGGDPQIAIPHRFYYSADERNTNPNIPDPSNQPLRNANDPF